MASEEVAARGPASVLEFGPALPPGILHGFRALRHRDFRLFYAGQLISLVGTWMQSLAQSWLILVLTGSAFALGIVGALQFLPVLLFSAFGGAIADRAPRRWILVGTQSVQMILAFILAVLTYSRVVTYVDVLILAFLLGLANCIDMPTRQAFVVDLVGPRDLGNAIALNSSMFNAARLIGPAIAGLLIGSIGIAGCFLLNGVSFFPVIVGLLQIGMDGRTLERTSSLEGVVDDLREGFQYVHQAPSLLAVIFLVGAIGTFGSNFNVVLPLLARNELAIGATGLGWLTAAMGFGSLVASLGIAYASGRPDPRIIVAAAASFAVFEVALASVSSYRAALVLLAVIGAMLVVVSALANTYIQVSVPDRLRGRVASIYTTVFVGTTPIGNTLAGAVAERTGAFGPLFYGGLASLAATIIVARWLKRVPAEAHLRRHARREER